MQLGEITEIRRAGIRRDAHDGLDDLEAGQCDFGVEADPGQCDFGVEADAAVGVLLKSRSWMSLT